MAGIFKRKVRLASGKTVTRQSQKCYTRPTDADGIKQTIPLFTNRTASQQRAAHLQKEIKLTRAEVADRYKQPQQKQRP
jgi:hypothetical protein